ncbi:hypothetical protein RVR_10602 [Actinacidiphila reveromycinica]|uniref:Uncharacterized protein n=1 Tax=Actinacidiphila reveromycinica TaxID=659352 RepID=A0A7U3VRA7_9ACTN|nr:hypothetical protein RVR_7739 [Streptomyces sp. SN-593]BBB00656.1 hypothetical protein RVR_10602 [Streptomyces sp. SN-593]
MAVLYQDPSDPVSRILIPANRLFQPYFSLDAVGELRMRYSLRMDAPAELLAAAEEFFGGTVKITSSFHSDTEDHELYTDWLGVPLIVSVRIPREDSLGALRKQVSDLEQQLAAQQPSEDDESQAVVDASHPVGTPVAAYPETREDEPLLTRTRTAAWVADRHTPVVMVEDHSAWIALSHVDARTEPAPTAVMPLAERPDPLESALLSAWNNSEPEMPECHRCGNARGPWAPDPSGDRWPSGAQKLVCQVGCTAGGERP